MHVTARARHTICRHGPARYCFGRAVQPALPITFIRRDFKFSRNASSPLHPKIASKHWQHLPVTANRQDRVATAAVVRPHEGRPQGRAAPGAGHCRAARVGGRRGSPRASPAPRLCASPPALARPAAGCLQTAAGFGARKRSAAGRLATALPQQSKTGRGGRLGEGDGPWQIRRLARRSLLSESPSSLSLPLPLRVDPYNP